MEQLRTGELQKVWCYIPAVLALGRLSQEDPKFEASLYNLVKLCLEIREKNFKGRNRVNKPLGQSQRQTGNRRPWLCYAFTCEHCNSHKFSLR
jgi:hypothetical protein